MGSSLFQGSSGGMFFCGIDPGMVNSAIAVFNDDILIYESKMAPIKNMDFLPWYHDLVWGFTLMGPRARVTVERFTMRKIHMRIMETCCLQVGMVMTLCLQHGYDLRLVTAQSWKRTMKPEYPRGVDRHLWDAKCIAKL